MAIENIYLFTEDNEKVCIGRYDTTPLVEVPLLRNWDFGATVFYDIPEGTEVYLDSAGTQPVVACSTVLSNSEYTSVWVKGNGVLGYIYRYYLAADVVEYPDLASIYYIQPITNSFLLSRYNDGSLSLVLSGSSGEPILSGDITAGGQFQGLDMSTGQIVSGISQCNVVLNNHICVDSIGKVPVSIARNSDDGDNTIFVDYSDSSRSIRDRSLVSVPNSSNYFYYKENGVGMTAGISVHGGGSN